MIWPSLKELWNEKRKTLSPKRELSHVEFSRKIILPDGRSKGLPYKVETHQVQHAILQEMDQNSPTSVTIVKPVQDGGTLTSLVPLFKRVMEGQTVVLAYPTLDSAKDIWTTKVFPILKGFGGVEPTKGGGSQGGAARVIQLPTGGQFMLRAAGGRGESQQASVTGDAVQIDEMDDWQEFHRTELISRRIEEAADPLVIRVSTVKKAVDSNILKAFEQGSRSRLHYRCPHCLKYQTLEFENVHFEEKDYTLVKDSTYIGCIVNGCVIRENDRKLMLKEWKILHFGQNMDLDGNITGDNHRSNDFSIIWNRIESPRKPLFDLVEKYLKAKWYLEVRGEHGPMRSFMQDYLCTPYTGDIEELEMGRLILWQDLIDKANSQDWGPSQHSQDKEEINGSITSTFSRHIATPSDDAVWSIAAVDVQHDRVYWVITGVNGDGTTWDYAWGFEYARSDHKPGSEAEMLALFYRTSTLLESLCGDTTFVLAGIDVGDRPELIGGWVDEIGGVWKKVKGASNSNMKLEPDDIPGMAHYRNGVIHVNVDAARELYQNVIRRPHNTPGCVYFPSGVSQPTSAFFKHLTSRQTSIDIKTKKKIIVRGPGREDWLDCRVYITALIVGWLISKRKLDTAETFRNAEVSRTPRHSSLPRDEEEQPSRSRSIKTDLQVRTQYQQNRIGSFGRGTVQGRQFAQRRWR